MRTVLGIGAAMLLVSCGGRPAPEDAPRAEVATDWAKLPEDAAWGQVSAVDVDSHGHVFVLQRAGRMWEEPFPTDAIAEPTVYMVAANGVLLGKWGAGELVMPHGLSVDGEDKVWITDVQREQVLRFSHDGTFEMAIGERGVTADDQGHFGRPADIAFAGEKVFIADGYVNSRVVVFDREGHFVTQWGHEGSGRGGLAIPHGIAVEDGKVYLADRENSRIKIFTEAGKLLETYDTPGHPYAVKPMGGGWFITLEARDAGDRSGAIMRVWRPDGTIERIFDAREEGPTKGHDFALGKDGTIYIANVEGDDILTVDLARAGKP